MRQKIKSSIKIYLLLLIYLTISAVIYTIYINKTNNDFNIIVKLLLGGLAYMMLGFTYANAVHKKGLIIGLLAGVFHFLLIQIIYFLISGIFNFQIIPFTISTLLAGIGGLLGVNLKKLF